MQVGELPRLAGVEQLPHDSTEVVSDGGEGRRRSATDVPSWATELNCRGDDQAEVQPDGDS
ncbi:MAG TPA: hypothetical protein VGN57_04055 [Pirellulaceae bacterium]|nr:hypothetical protein [Pirellulaceae bacterium]